MKAFNFRVFCITLVGFNTPLYFIFSHLKGYDPWPQLMLIIVGLLCVVYSFVPTKKKSL